jgi:hypothetical protein
MDSSEAIIEELSDRITTYNSIIEDSDNFQEKADAKHDLAIILESPSYYQAFLKSSPKRTASKFYCTLF